MNLVPMSQPLSPQPLPVQPVVPAVAAEARASRPHRERDFGVGYGRSSGYASQSRYTRDWAAPRFRCA